MRLGDDRCGSGTTGLGQTDEVHPALLALGALLTITGAAGLVVAFRHGRAGRDRAERRMFRLSTASLAAGSLALLATVVLAGRS